MPPASQYVSNSDFAEAVGISISMASRLRNGHRLPGADLLDRIAEFYDVSLEDLHDARRAGNVSFAKYLREHVLGDFDYEPTPIN